MFLFVAAFTDCATGFVHSGSIKRVHKMYTEIVNRMTKDYDEGGDSLHLLVDVKCDTERFKKIMKRAFREHCETGLFITKFYFVGSHI